MIRVVWELHEYTEDDDVIYHQFKNKREAVAKSVKIAAENPPTANSCYTLKKYVVRGWIQQYVGVQWDDDEVLDGEWDVRPDGIHEIVSGKKAMVR